MDNLLKEYFTKNTGNLINKWLHYFEIYDRYFSKFKDAEIVLLELGIFQGGSLDMWKMYFGARVKIYAIDINPECKKFEDDQVKVFIGSQEDRQFLRSIKNKIPKVDLLIDDGGHTMQQQIITFEEMYDHVKNEGIYFIEDLHTSYIEKYGGGLKYKNSFIEYSKNLIDILNAWHYDNASLRFPQMQLLKKSTYALHFFDSILIIEKRNVVQPISKTTGVGTIPIETFVYETRSIGYGRLKWFDRFKAYLRVLKRQFLKKMNLSNKD